MSYSSHTKRNANEHRTVKIVVNLVFKKVYSRLFRMQLFNILKSRNFSLHITKIPKNVYSVENVHVCWVSGCHNGKSITVIA